MLYFFRVNDPFRLIGLLVILIIIYLPYLIDATPLVYPELRSFIIGEKISEGNMPYSGIMDSIGPLTSWFYGFMDMVAGRSLTSRHIVGILILYFQSAYIGIMFINKKAFTENTYLPAFLFAILMFFSFDTITLTGELLGSGFLLLALSNLLKVIEFRTQRDETFLNLGLFVSIASLFDLSLIVFLLAVCAILLVFTRSALRTYILIIFGFLLPHLFMISIYFLNDQAAVLLKCYYVANLSFSSLHLMNTKGLLVLGAFPLAYFFISLVMLNRDSRFTKYQSQLRQLMFIWMIFSLLQVLYSKELTPQSFITLIPGFAFFITHFLLVIRRKRFAELYVWILFLGILSVGYMARYGHLVSVNYNRLIVSQVDTNKTIRGKRILVVGDQMPLFVNNKLATPFYNWQLTKEIFEAPDYYENVLKVYEAFREDSPEIIIDKNQYMKAFMDRIPEIEKQYTLSSPGIYTRRN